MDNICIRRAVPEDINTLAEHHTLMFKEICAIDEKSFPDETFQKIFNATVRKLSLELPKEICVAWIVEIDKQTAGSGSLSVISKTATPVSPDTHMAAYLHSVYIYKEFRGQKLTRLILKEAEKYCSQNSIHEITLRASKAGRPIYESSCYKPVTNCMNKFLI